MIEENSSKSTNAILWLLKIYIYKIYIFMKWVNGVLCNVHNAEYTALVVICEPAYYE